MKLISSEDKSLFAAFVPGKAPYFKDAFLQSAMQKWGVDIPLSKQSAFGGKKRVFPEDSDFPKAFREIYYVEHLNQERYHWDDEQ